MMADIDFALGLIAGEGSFTIDKTQSRRTGTVYPRPKFTLGMKDDEEYLILEVREIFGNLGTICEMATGAIHWQVASAEELKKFVDKIRKYRCGAWYASGKYQDFKAWSRAVDIYSKDRRTTLEDRIEMAKLAPKTARGGREGHDWDETIKKMKSQ